MKTGTYVDLIEIVVFGQNKPSNEMAATINNSDFSKEDCATAAKILGIKASTMMAFNREIREKANLIISGLNPHAPKAA